MRTLYAAGNARTHLLHIQSRKNAGHIAVQLCFWVRSASHFVISILQIVAYIFVLYFYFDMELIIGIFEVLLTNLFVSYFKKLSDVYTPND